MAKVEMVLQFIENGSNSMTTYQALMAAANSQNDSLSVIQNGTNLVATISNVAPMMQPVRIMTNGLAATSALIRIATDWKDPNKKVQAGDVLTDASNHGYMRVWGGQYRARVDHAGDSGFTFTVVSVRRRRA